MAQKVTKKVTKKRVKKNVSKSDLLMFMVLDELEQLRFLQRLVLIQILVLRI